MPDAYITFNSETYNPAYSGVYTIVVSYHWGGTGNINLVTKTFTYTLHDCCAELLKPPIFINLTGYLHDSNSFKDTAASINPTKYDFCTVSISVTVTKNSIADTSGFV